MSADAVVRLSGHRLRFIPFPPFRLTRLAPSFDAPKDSIHMVRVHEGEVRQFELRPGALDASPAPLTRVEGAPEGWASYRMGERGAEVRLRSGLLPRLDADGSVLEGPADDAWTVETSFFRCAWPEGLTLASTEKGAPSPFEFYGPEGAVLFLQGPLPREALPALEGMAAAEQRVLGTGEESSAPFVDLAYELDGRPWRQRHLILGVTPTHVMVLTAQAPERHMPAMQEKARELVVSFRPGRPRDLP